MQNLIEPDFDAMLDDKKEKDNTDKAELSSLDREVEHVINNPNLLILLTSDLEPVNIAPK